MKSMFGLILGFIAICAIVGFLVLKFIFKIL